MPETLSDLLRRHGLGTTTVPGIGAPTLSRIANGHTRARGSTARRIAKALSEPIENVVKACDASWSAKHAAPAPAVGPVADGQPAATGD